MYVQQLRSGAEPSPRFSVECIRGQSPTGFQMIRNLAGHVSLPDSQLSLPPGMRGPVCLLSVTVPSTTKGPKTVFNKTRRGLKEAAGRPAGGVWTIPRGPCESCCTRVKREELKRFADRTAQEPGPGGVGYCPAHISARWRHQLSGPSAPAVVDSGDHPHRGAGQPRCPHLGTLTRRVNG